MKPSLSFGDAQGYSCCHHFTLSFGCTSVLTRFTKASCPDLEKVEVVSLTSRRSAVPARSHPSLRVLAVV